MSRVNIMCLSPRVSASSPLPPCSNFPHQKVLTPRGTRAATVRRMALQCPASFTTNFTCLLEADSQPHQHCSSDHPGPALTWRGTVGTYVAPVPSMSGQRSSAGQPDVRQGVFTHTCSPGHSSASFWMMSTTATRKSQANRNPSRQKENVLLAYSP